MYRAYLNGKQQILTDFFHPIKLPFPAILKKGEVRQIKSS